MPQLTPEAVERIIAERTARRWDRLRRLYGLPPDTPPATLAELDRQHARHVKQAFGISQQDLKGPKTPPSSP